MFHVKHRQAVPQRSKPPQPPTVHGPGSLTTCSAGGIHAAPAGPPRSAVREAADQIAVFLRSSRKQLSQRCRLHGPTSTSAAMFHVKRRWSNTSPPRAGTVPHPPPGAARVRSDATRRATLRRAHDSHSRKTPRPLHRGVEFVVNTSERATSDAPLACTTELLAPTPTPGRCTAYRVRRHDCARVCTPHPTMHRAVQVHGALDFPAATPAHGIGL